MLVWTKMFELAFLLPFFLLFVAKTVYIIMIELSLNCIHSIKLGLLPNFENRNRKKRPYIPHGFPLDQTTFFTPSTINKRVLTQIIANTNHPLF